MNGDGRGGVVLATRGPAASLPRTPPELPPLPEQPHIVVVDNASSDGTVDMVRSEHPQLRLVALDHNLGAAARTIGVRVLNTPYAAFADDDSWWAPGALRAAADIFDAHPRLAL